MGGENVDILGNDVSAHAKEGYVRETNPPVDNGPDKGADGVDISTLIASLFTVQATDAFFEVSQPEVQRTVNFLVEIYSSNIWEIQDQDRLHMVPGILAGRFQNDNWNGYN